MKKSIFFVTAFLFIVSLTAQNSAFTNVHLIPMDSERVLENQTVLIIDGFIVKIGPTSETEIPNDALIIDAKGQYLTPGLSDMHVHLRNSDELINYLSYGVTTIMHMGGTRTQGKQSLKYRDEIHEGKKVGPYIYATGRIFDGDPPASGGAYRISNPQLAIELIDELKRDGFDFIKIYNNIELPLFKTIVTEGNHLGLPIFGHLTRKFDVLTAINNGQDLVAHTEEFFFTYFKGPRSTKNIDKNYSPDYSLIPNLVAALKQNKVAVIPNLSHAYADFVMWDDLENLFMDPEIKYVSPVIIRNEFHNGNINRRSSIENFIYRDQIKYNLSQKLTLRFQQEDILQLLGTDGSMAGLFPGKSAHRELTELVKAGLTNYEALSVATKNAGVFAKNNNLKGGDFGQIKEGFRADLILLEQNPLNDIRNTRLLTGVMTQGKWFDRTEMSVLREQIAAKYSKLKNIETQLVESVPFKTTHKIIEQLIVSNGNDKDILKMIESNINSLGYSYVSKNDLETAIYLFELNTKFFSTSGNVWDSYAEAHLINGSKDLAIKYYSKALEVDPNLSSAKEQLNKLTKD